MRKIHITFGHCSSYSHENSKKRKRKAEDDLRERERERIHLVNLSATAPQCKKECFGSFVGWLYAQAYFMNATKEKEKARREVSGLTTL